MTTTHDAPAANMALTDVIYQSFNDPEFSDLLVVCGKRKWYCHKLVLFKQSTFFRNAVTAHDRHSFTSRQDPKAVIKLHDYDERLPPLEAALRFCYGHDYDDQVVYEDEMTPTVFNMQVFRVGEAFFLPGLQKLARDKFVLALESATCEDIGVAVDWVHDRFSDPDRLLKDAIVAHVLKHASDPADDDIDLLSYLLSWGYAGFAADMAGAFAQKVRALETGSN